MSKVKNLKDCNLYYTDSIVIDKPLNNNLVGKELGKYKLEYEINEGIFLCPKVYAIKVLNEKSEPIEVIKIKGVNIDKIIIDNNKKNPTSFDNLKTLLI